MSLITSVEAKIQQLLKNFEQIPQERKELLESFSNYIQNKISNEEDVNLIFICTHNSRRSILSQIWAQSSAEYFSIPSVKCYSGGTEKTAFNPKAVNTIIKSGFIVSIKDQSSNPVYLVNYSNDKGAIECFSKVYNDNYNPQNKFTAILTCSDADENCPIIHGADARYPIKYEDPKIYDNTDLEAKMYIERSDQIGTEMLYVFKNINL